MKKKVMSIRIQAKYMRIFCDYCHENRCFTVPVKDASLVHLAHESDFVSNLRVLHGMGYITVNWVIGVRPEYIMVTPEGFAFFEKRSARFRQCILEKLLLPILLSIITAVVTVLLIEPIKSALEKALQSLLQLL